MRKLLMLTMALLMLFGLLAAGGCTNGADDDVLKVGVIYISPKDDGGWSQAHAEGIAMAKDVHGDKIEVLEIEDVIDDDKQATTNAIENLISQGCGLIIATSYGYMEAVAEAAEAHPDVKFVHCSGYLSNSTNFDNYFGQIEGPRYLSGMVAGMMTETNKLGYVAAFPIPEVVRGINAYTLGAKSVNPDVTVQVVWTMTWFDMDIEKAAAESLLAQGVDVMSQHQDSPAAINAAEAAGAYAVGYDLTYAGAPDAYLTAPLWKWGSYYAYKIEQILNDAWTIDLYWGDMADGIIELDDITDLVSQDVKDIVAEEEAKMLDDTNAHVFAGPIYDQSGELRVEENESLDFNAQMSMDWFVQGVIGDVQ